MNAIKTSLKYLKSGAALTLRAPVLFAQIVVMFSLPALGAALLAGTIASGGNWGVLLVTLDSLTTVVGPVVFMMAVGAGHRREATSFGQVVLQALPWLPRYIWTNVHTSVIFWLPVGSVVLLRGWLESGLGQTGVLDGVVTWGFVFLVGGLAAYFHSRTLWQCIVTSPRLGQPGSPGSSAGAISPTWWRRFSFALPRWRLRRP